MDSHDNLYSSQSPLPIHSSLATLDDRQKAHQVTQLNFSNTFTPPGAVIIRPTTSDHSQHSFYNQSDGSTTSLSVPSPSHSISPAPRPSHVFELHPSFLRRS